MFEMKMNNSVSEQHSKHNPNSATRSTASRLATRPSVARFSRVSGFTLIEVMVVIVILGVLAALIVPNVMGLV